MVGLEHMEYLLAIDQGTTGTTALIVDRDLNKIADASVDFEQSFPKPGWVEHDLEAIWKTVIQTVGEVTKKVDPKRIVAIGITNQRETVCFWDRKTSKPLAPAIVWQDRRTAKFCEDLKKQGKESIFQDKTGLVLDPYFSGTKVAWAINNWDDVKKALKQGCLAAGTIDSFLVAKLSDGEAHVTEPSNASRTLCFNLTDHVWDSELCATLGIPTTIWPEIKPSLTSLAVTKNFPNLPDGIPVTGILGDQQAALLGQACIREGMGKCTYGTGAFILVNTGSKPVKSTHRLVSTVAWSRSTDEYVYALEGSAFIAGAAVQWLRDGLGVIKESSEIETLASSVASSEGVFFVPALTGLGAPFWNPNARGLFSGITRGTTKAHIARAVLEGIAYQIADIVEAMKKDTSQPIVSFNVDGGAAANNLLMQLQADLLGVRLKRPKYLESTSLGAVFAAGLGAGVWTDFSDIEKSWKLDRCFEPILNDKQREESLHGWHTAISRAML